MRCAPRARNAPLAATLLLLACAAPNQGTPLSEVPQPSGTDSTSRGQASRAESSNELVESLLTLADRALARSEFDAAEDRYERALESAPDSIRAQLGLSRVAMARGDTESARKYLETAIARDPLAADAVLDLALFERDHGDIERARELARRAVEIDAMNPRAHQALAEMSGLVPQPRVVGVEEAVRLATRHPYDPAALLRAGRTLADRGRIAEAIETLSSAVWLADLDPPSSLAAIKLLARLDPAWARKRVVPVNSWADQTVRADPYWKMRMRLAWGWASHALDPALETIFVPVSIDGFETAPASGRLDEIERDWLRGARVSRAIGIDAIFTERLPTARRSPWRLGQAEFLGRRMVVRLEEGKVQSLVLAHEVLHLYGAVHIADEVPSLMNSSGTETRLDLANQRITSLLRERRFGVGGLESNVIPYTDVDSLVSAYTGMLRANLAFRQLGIEQALEARETSRYVAADIARESVELDPHLADVAVFVAQLMIHKHRLLPAIRLFEAASRLYGVDTPDGRQAGRRVDELLSLARQRLGQEGSVIREPPR